MAYTGLAKTTFMAGPEDALAAADAYSANDLTTTTTENVDYSLPLPETPLGIKIKPPGMDGLGLKVPKLEQADVLKAIASDVSIKNCFTNMADSAKSLLSIPGKMLGKVEATINGVVNKIKNLSNIKGGFDLKGALEKIGNLKAIGCTANSLSNGNFSLNIVDKGGLSGLIAGVTKQANSLGINNVFSTISNVVKDKDVLLAACKDVLSVASRDFNLLKDLASTDIKGSIKSMLPSISGDSIKNFKINPGTSFNSLPSVFNDLEYTLNRVDSAWNNVVRGGESVLSGINTVSNQATDFHTAMSSSVMADYSLLPTVDSTDANNKMFYLSTEASDNAFLMTTKNVGEQDITSLIKEQYPTLPVDINPSTSNQSLVDKIQAGLDNTKATYETLFYGKPDETIVKISTNSENNTTTVTPDNPKDDYSNNYSTPTPSNVETPPDYPPLGTYLGTAERKMNVAIIKVETSQGPMNGSIPSYDHVITTTSLLIDEKVTIEHMNTPNRKFSDLF